MKKLITGILLTVCMGVFVLPNADAQVMWRGAKTMKKGSFIAMAQWYNMDFTQKYVWTDEEWKDEDNDYLKWGFETMFGYAITNRWEAMVHIPFRFHSFTTPTADETNSGVGDIFLKTRVGVLPWAKDKHGLTLLGSVRFGSGDYDHPYSFCNCGDGTVDFGLAEIFSTKWMSDFRGHVKANYWINGKNDDDYDIGDELKVILKLDRNFHKKFMGFATYIYYSQFKKKNPDGDEIDESQKIRHNFVLGGVWKPKKGLFIRPKIVFPGGGEGGKNFGFKPVLDFWYVFKVF